MADINCPMCGKPNPESAETCRFCQARLKPLHIDNSSDQAAGTPDWLSALLGSQPESEPTLPQPSEEPPAFEIPTSPEPVQPAPEDEGKEDEDWLARIRQRTQEEGDAVSRFGPQPVVPPEEERQAALSGEDWLKDLQGVATSQPGLEPEPEEQPAEPQQDDWLNRLREQRAAEQESAETTPPNIPPSAQPEQPIDWAASLRLAAEQPAPEQPAAEPAAEPAPAAPDWMAAYQPPAEENEIKPEAEKPSAEVPDWMAAFRGQAAEEQPAAEQPAAEMPDWMAAYQPPTEESAPQTPVEKAPEMPDWMSSFRGLAEETPPAEEQSETVLPEAEAAPVEPAAEVPVEPATVPAPEVPASEESPDWMNAFIEAAPEETAPEIPPQANAEAPDWLKSYSEKLMGSAEITPAEAVPAEETPEWLRGLAAASEEPKPDEETSPEPAPEQPDWLKSFEPAAQIDAGTSGETPDWLKEYEKENQPAGEPEQALEQIGPFSEDTPQWLKSFAEENNLEKVPPLQATPPLDFTAGTSLPSGESDKKPALEPTEAGPAVPAQAFEPGDLPDWLAAEAQEGSGEAGKSAETSDRIEPAQLPAWLQAMRPVEAVPLDAGLPVNDQHIEKAGPLAGMRGVLVGENAAAEYQKPAVYSTKLLVTDRQRLQANLLEELLTNENRPAEIRTEHIQTTQLIGRMVAAVVLLCAILAALLIPFQNELPSDMSAPGTPAYKLFQIVNSLPENAPVLLAVDYDAGLSGEMRNASAGVVQNLMLLKARLALVSTTINGPALGENLLETASKGIPDYSVANSTVNLGYLPAGANSLQELAAGTLSSVIGAPQRSNGDWTDPTLAGVQRVSDFALVVVVTDNADTARYWIEQVQPALGGTKMVMVISAQSAAIIQPYEGRQVAAIISGLTGGMAYSNIAGLTGAPTNYWTAYQIGVVVIIVFILLGVILQGVLDVTNRQKSKHKV